MTKQLLADCVSWMYVQTHSVSELQANSMFPLLCAIGATFHHTVQFFTCRLHAKHGVVSQTDDVVFLSCTILACACTWLHECNTPKHSDTILQSIMFCMHSSWEDWRLDSIIGSHGFLFHKVSCLLAPEIVIRLFVFRIVVKSCCDCVCFSLALGSLHGHATARPNLGIVWVSDGGMLSHVSVFYLSTNTVEFMLWDYM